MATLRTIESTVDDLEAPIRTVMSGILGDEERPYLCYVTRLEGRGDYIYVLAVTHFEIIIIKSADKKISFELMYLDEVAYISGPEVNLGVAPKPKIWIVGPNGNYEIEFPFENQEILYEFVHRLRRRIREFKYIKKQQ